MFNYFEGILGYRCPRKKMKIFLESAVQMQTCGVITLWNFIGNKLESACLFVHAAKCLVDGGNWQKVIYCIMNDIIMSYCDALPLIPCNASLSMLITGIPLE